MGTAQALSKAIILVVEDEPLLRMMAVELVEDSGLEAIDAANADCALAILDSRADIRVLFTDVDMPGSMDGVELATRVRNQWPGIEIIVTSGHVRSSEVRLPSGCVFYPKPYDHRTMTSKILELSSGGSKICG